MARDHPHVHADVVLTADALERLLLEKPQELRLQPRHHLADLVEEHRAAVGRLEQAALLLAGVGEGAALVTEQLAFEQGLRDRRARDVHERPVGPVAVEVQDLGGQVLARAAFAGEQHRGRWAGGHLAQQLLQAGHQRRLADDAVEAVGLRLTGAQAPHFAAQAGRLERAAHDRGDVVEVEGLVGEVVRARSSSPRRRSRRWRTR